MSTLCSAAMRRTTGEERAWRSSSAVISAGAPAGSGLAAGASEGSAAAGEGAGVEAEGSAAVGGGARRLAGAEASGAADGAGPPGRSSSRR